MRFSRTAAAGVFGVLLLSISPARANGMLGHMYVSELALDELPAGKLRTLLENHRDHYLNGSFLPDSGYAANDGYGEIAHWSGFVNGYLQWIRETYSPPYDQGEAAAHVAVLMGAASHGMCDQVFDILLFDKSAQIDGDPGELDTGTDVWLVNDREIDYDPPIVVDTVALATIFQTYTDHEVSPGTIQQGMETAKSAHNVVEIVLAPSHQSFRDQYPWASQAYLEPEVPGSYPFNAKVIANYWQQIWKRLNGDNSIDGGVVIGSSPWPDSVNWAVDHQDLDSWVSLFLGQGMKRDTLTENSIFVTNAVGNRVSTDIRLRGDQWASTVQLRPLADWQFKTDYTVHLNGDAQTLNETSLSQEHFFSFTTACAPGDDSCPSEVDAGDIGSGGNAPSDSSSDLAARDSSDSSGCRWSPRPLNSGMAPWALLVVLGLTRRFVKRSRRL